MPTLVRRSNGIYYQITYLNGRRIWRSTGARRRSEAKKIIREGVVESRPDLTVTQFATQFFPYMQTNLAAQFARKAGLPDEIHFHSLRHTGATWLVQSGVPISYVREILGHSSLSTTMIYAHSTSDYLRESVCRLDNFLAN